MGDLSHGGGLDDLGGGGFGEEVEGKTETMESGLKDSVLSRFISNAPAPELYHQLKAVMQTIDGATIANKDECFKVKTTVDFGQGSLTIAAQIFVDDKNSDIHHVVFQRLSGNGIMFRGLYLAICEKFDEYILKPEKKAEEKKE